MKPAGIRHLFLVLLHAAAGATEPVVLPFLPLGNGLPRPGLVGEQDSTCGRLVLARVLALPSARTTALGAPDAWVLDAQGTPQSRWALPADAEPLAWQGSDLLVRSGGAVVRLGPNRQVMREPGPPPSLPAAAACPGPARLGWVCVPLPDLQDPGAGPRWLAHAPPCRLR